MCYLVWGWCLSERVMHVVAAAGFLSCHLNGPLPYVRQHINSFKNVLSVSLNKKIPFFFPFRIAGFKCRHSVKLKKAVV